VTKQEFIVVLDTRGVRHFFITFLFLLKNSIGWSVKDILQIII